MKHIKFQLATSFIDTLQNEKIDEIILAKLWYLVSTEPFPAGISSLNSHMVMKWYRELDVAQKRGPIFFSVSFVKFQGHETKKIVDIDTNWAFPVCNSNLNSLMATKMMHKPWSGIEEVPYYFRGQSWNFKVKRLKKLSILTQIGCFRTVAPVCIRQWLRNDAHSLK